MSYSENTFFPSWDTSDGELDNLLSKKDVWRFDRSQIKRKDDEICENHTDTNILKEVDKFIQENNFINPNFYSLDLDFSSFPTIKDPFSFRPESKKDNEQLLRYVDVYWGMNIEKPNQEQLPPGLGLTTPLEQESNLRTRLENGINQISTEKHVHPSGLSNPMTSTNNSASEESNNTINYVLPSKEELKKRKKMAEEQKNKLASNNDQITKEKITQKHTPIVQNHPKNNLVNSIPTTKKVTNSLHKQENKQESTPKSSITKPKNVQPTVGTNTKPVVIKKDSKEEAKVNKIDTKGEKFLKEIAMNNQFMALQSNYTEFISEPTEPIKEVPRELPVQKNDQPKASPKNKAPEKPKVQEPAQINSKPAETKQVETPANNEQAVNKKKKKKNKKKKTEAEQACELEMIQEVSRENKKEIQQINPPSPKNNQEQIPVIPQNKPVQNEEKKTVQPSIEQAKQVIRLTQTPQKTMEGKTGRDIIDEDSDEEESEYIVTSCVEGDGIQIKQDEGVKRLTRTQKKNMKKRNKQKQNKEGKDIGPTKNINTTTNDVVFEPVLRKLEDCVPAEKVEEKAPVKVEYKVEPAKIEENSEKGINDGYEFDYLINSSYMTITPNYYAAGMKFVDVEDLDQSAAHE